MAHRPSEMRNAPFQTAFRTTRTAPFPTPYPKQPRIPHAHFRPTLFRPDPRQRRRPRFLSARPTVQPHRRTGRRRSLLCHLQHAQRPRHRQHAGVQPRRRPAAADGGRPRRSPVQTPADVRPARQSRLRTPARLRRGRPSERRRNRPARRRTAPFLPVCRFRRPHRMHPAPRRHPAGR